MYSFLNQLEGITVSVTPWVVVDGYQIFGRKTINTVKCLNTKNVKPQPARIPTALVPKVNQFTTFGVNLRIYY
jgi:hypothetical protein